MKLIKKIAAIMFAFMMVFSLSTNVKAVESGVNENQGSIVIENAKNGETYKIYRILDLDSYEYSGENNEKKEGNYSYTLKQDGTDVKNANQWQNFVKRNADGKGSNFFKLTDEKYVTVTDDYKNNGEGIAKAALKYVQDPNNNIEADVTNKSNVDGPLTFGNLPLGYYLVESSVGAVCNLTTTNPSQKIQVKYTEPTVEKNILSNDGILVKNTSANIGDQIHYQVKITLGKGAKNYVFHDQIDDGLQYNEHKNKVWVMITKEDNTPIADDNNSYTIDYAADKKSFTLNFEDSFIQQYSENQSLILTYIATVTKEAKVDTALKNIAYLNYGNNQKTGDQVANVWTYKIPVFKYYFQGSGKWSTEKPLAGATFNLYEGSETPDKLMKFSKDENGYTIDIEKSKTNSADLVSDGTGYININGLATGTYILKETKAPRGYNKLTKTINIKVEQNTDGTKKITYDDVIDPVTEVKVENKSGTLLPSTGGMGTTLIYLIGGALVLGSGFVLANKKRAKAK